MRIIVYVIIIFSLISCRIKKADRIVKIKKEKVEIIDTTLDCPLKYNMERSMLGRGRSNKKSENETKPSLKIKSIKEKKPPIKIDIVDNTKKEDSNKNSIGLMAYSNPDQMTVGKEYTIKLRISKEKNSVILINGDRNIPINDIKVNSKVTIESIRVESIMSAQLMFDKERFEVSPASTELQNIEDSGYTEWEWKIIPLKSGENFLKLIVKVRIKDGNNESFKDITVFDKNIDIKSNIIFSLKLWFKNYWQWLSTTVIIPFIVWWWNRRKKRKKI